ncbi:MAG: hypothetical protein ACI9N9_002879 [Enterobacterales bacterium]|jgi:hypothetical protein|tara:strand:- start:313 stop:1065 length:753 start_codon:yes stop_codon:yes gene_type:complete
MTNIDSQVGVQKILMEWVPHYPPEVTDWDIIRAAMLFANDKIFFDSNIIAISISRQMYKFNKWDMEPYWKKLIANKVDDRRIEKRALEEHRKGHIAGWMFAYLYTMVCDKHIEEPSKSKAAHLVSKSVKGKCWANSDKAIPSTPRHISKVFSEKSSVLHYWSALVFSNMGVSGFDIGRAKTDTELVTFLQMSKALQKFGLTYTSARNKDDSPPVCNKSMWLVSDSIESFDLLLGDTRDEVYNYLKSYSVN